MSRFQVSKDDPTKADPASEEEILRFENDRSGTTTAARSASARTATCTSSHGDGGAANDPHDNGQNLKTLLGKILRIDVERKDDGKNYAIPKDNPFVGKKDALPEIWAYGLRNIWRMAFDRKTGKLWAGEVGQNLYEEINLIEKGGNYGWNRRESAAPVRRRRASARDKDLIEPIWEYHHDVGKSITGGHVYRGKRAAGAGGPLPLRRLRHVEDLGAEVRREGRSASSPTGRSRTRACRCCRSARTRRARSTSSSSPPTAAASIGS